MILVAGGFEWLGSRLDSTELYDSVAGTWTTAGAKLPSPLNGLRATNINNKVLIFGINISFVIQRYNQGLIIVGGYAGGSRDTILEYDMEQDTMQEIGNMRDARSQHAITVVQYSDFSQWCQ